MAPMTSSSSKPADNEVSIEEIVFSCSICQATISEVYATTESNQGFHSGSGDEDGIITKFWITECSHITCAKHLENGGVYHPQLATCRDLIATKAAPFHPKGMAPRASCPKCLRDKGDDAPKNLYGIRGLGEGEYDPMIPSEWRRCPAIKLDSSTPEISAVRFQYMALVHFSQQVRKHWKSAQDKQLTIESAYSKERKQRRQLQSELQTIQQRLETLEKREVEFKKWEDRKPMISHYLGAIEKMSNEMNDMRNQLLEFGVVVPKTDYTFGPSRTSQKSYLSPAQTAYPTIARSQNADPGSTRYHEQENSSSARKRKREDYEGVGAHHGAAAAQRPNAASRDLMPPPLPKHKPQQRVTNDTSGMRASSTMQRPPSSQQAIPVYYDGSQNPRDLDVNGSQAFPRGEARNQNGASAQMELPYRPSVAGSIASRGSVRDLATFGANLREVQQKPLNPAASHFYSQHQTANDYATLQQQQQQHIPQPNREVRSRQFTREPFTVLQNLYHQPSSESFHTRRSSEQQDGAMRLPVQALSDFESNRRVPSTPRIHQQNAAIPLYQDTSHSTRNEPSPFFQRNDRFNGPPPTQRPPTRGSMVRTERCAPSQHGAAVQRVPISSYGYPGSNGQFQNSNELPSTSYSVQRPSAGPAHNPPFRRPNIAPQYPHKTPIPQTPRNSQGLFHRPDRPPPSAMHYEPRPQANTNRSRISLPPNHVSQMQMNGNQDGALLHVPGLRGLSSQHGMSSKQRRSSAYDAPRNLFSSAGGRRSVLR